MCLYRLDTVISPLGLSDRRSVFCANTSRCVEVAASRKLAKPSNMETRDKVRKKDYGMSGSPALVQSRKTRFGGSPREGRKTYSASWSA